MNYSKITYPDLNNGTGCRVSLWASGCTLKCKECFNSELWDFKYGYKFSVDVQNKLFEILQLPYIKGLSILGGEPTDQGQELVDFIESVKNKFPDKDIWMWTGRTMQELIDSGSTKLLQFVDFVVDGRFEKDLADLNLKFRGSTNQNIWHKINNVWTITN